MRISSSAPSSSTPSLTERFARNSSSAFASSSRLEEKSAAAVSRSQPRSARAASISASTLDEGSRLSGRESKTASSSVRSAPSVAAEGLASVALSAAPERGESDGGNGSRRSERINDVVGDV